MTPTKGSSKRTDAVTNRARILDAAQSVIAERGLELEMNEVAARAHLGVGTLYGHFANREGLLRAVVLRVLDDVLAQQRATQASAADDPRAALQALVSGSLHMIQQYRPLFAVIRDPRLVKLLDNAHGRSIQAQFLEIPRAMIERGIQAGIFRKDLDPEMAAVTLVGASVNAFDLLRTPTPSS